MSRYDRLFASVPLDQTAAVVASGGVVQEPPSLTEQRQQLFDSIRAAQFEIKTARGYRRHELQRLIEHLSDELRQIKVKIKQENIRNSDTDGFSVIFKNVVLEALGKERYLEMCHETRRRMDADKQVFVTNAKTRLSQHFNETVSETPSSIKSRMVPIVSATTKD